MSDPKWIQKALTYLGVKEGVGATDNPVVVAMFKDAGHPEVKRDSVAWCAAFVGAVLLRSGIKPTGTLWALDYAKWGLALRGPVVGAVASKPRKPSGGHVGFVVGYDKDKIYLLAGNQGDAVSIVGYPRSTPFTFRWPAGKTVPSPIPVSVKPPAPAGAVTSEA